MWFYTPFFTYILFSQKTESHYFGHSEDLTRRLNNHNKGKVKSTKSGRPWLILYSEEFSTKSEAFQREKFFKSLEGRKWLYDNNILQKKEARLILP